MTGLVGFEEGTDLLSKAPGLQLTMLLVCLSIAYTKCVLEVFASSRSVGGGGCISGITSCSPFCHKLVGKLLSP